MNAVKRYFPAPLQLRTKTDPVSNATSEILDIE
jgi:hypothetical protein